MITKDTLLPIASVLAVFTLAIGLILMGHRAPLNKQFEHAESFDKIAETIVRIHVASTDKHLTAATSVHLISDGGVSANLSAAAFRILLDFEHPSTSATLLAAYGSFDFAGRTVTGVRQAAGLVFGSTPENLSDTELSLYCRWVSDGQPSWLPADLIASRRYILSRMLARRLITPVQFENLNAKSLALRPTPIPIN